MLVPASTGRSTCGNTLGISRRSLNSWIGRQLASPRPPINANTGCCSVVGLELRAPGVARPAQLPHVQHPLAVRAVHAHVAGLAALLVLAHVGALVLDEGLHDIEHRAAPLGRHARLDHGGEMDLLLVDTGRRLGREREQIGRQRLHLRVAQRVARHHRIERLARGVDAAADGARQQRLGVRRALADCPAAP